MIIISVMLLPNQQHFIALVRRILKLINFQNPSISPYCIFKRKKFIHIKHGKKTSYCFFLVFKTCSKQRVLNDANTAVQLYAAISPFNVVYTCSNTPPAMNCLLMSLMLLTGLLYKACFTYCEVYNQLVTLWNSSLLFFLQEFLLNLQFAPLSLNSDPKEILWPDYVNDGIFDPERWNSLKMQSRPSSIPPKKGQLMV